MDNSRIFVGNLNIAVEQQHLEQEFSQYGKIANIELKNKLDFEGNTLAKFAYVTLNAQPRELNRCISSLNGASWRNSVLKVEVAKESFLQKLKREREQNLNDKKNSGEHDRKTESSFLPDISSDRPTYNFGQRKNNSSEFHRSKIAESDDMPIVHRSQYSEKNDMPIFHRSKNSEKNDMPVFHTSKASNKDDIPVFENDSRNKPYYNDRMDRQEKNSTFVSGMKRYDPTIPEHQQLYLRKQDMPTKVKKCRTEAPNNVGETFVKVFGEISFQNHSGAGGFSLMDQFSRRSEQEEQKHDKERNCERVLLSPVTPKFTKTEFFIRPDDPKLAKGAEWLLTPLTRDHQDEFERVRGELVDLYKLRNIRAVRNSKQHRDSKFRNRGKPRKPAVK